MRNLSKSFGPHWVLRQVDLEVAAGEFLTIFGPNGAGKTTLLRILATLSKPTLGDVWVGGVALKQDPNAIRRQVGLVSHQTLLYPDLTAEENLRFYGRMYGIPVLPERVAEMLQVVGLFERRHGLVRTFSRGMMQRLSIARAILHDPRVILMDEPYSGLDPQASESLHLLLRDLVHAHRTVILTSHEFEQGLADCDRVIILAGGRLAYMAPRAAVRVDEFRAIYRESTGGRR